MSTFLYEYEVYLNDAEYPLGKFAFPSDAIDYATVYARDFGMRGDKIYVRSIERGEVYTHCGIKCFGDGTWDAFEV